METMVTTKTNLQVVQDAYADFQKGNIQGILDVCSEDVIWKTYDHPEIPATGTYIGKTGVQHFFQVLDESVEFLDFQPLEFIDKDENVVVIGRQTAKARPTGKTFSHQWCMHFKMREGRVYSYYAYLDTLDQYKAWH